MKIGALGLMLVLFVLVFTRSPLRGHELACAAFASPHEQKVCKTLSDTMEWEWFGHAIVAPGWRVTWNSVRLTFCDLKLSSSDLLALEAMDRVLLSSPAADWRLAFGVSGLIRLLRPESDPASIFNPDNPSYILKDGCLAP